MDEQLPLIVQSDLTLLLEVQSSLFEQTRKAIAPFAEIVKSPEYIYTYQITDLSLSGMQHTLVKKLGYFLPSKSSNGG